MFRVVVGAGADRRGDRFGRRYPTGRLFALPVGFDSVRFGRQGLDAAAVFYHDQYLPIYFEILATVAIDKAMAGWDGNAYVIFDYFSPTDFKFVGINQKTNKLEMGQRTTAGWIVVAQSPLKIWENTNYSLLIAINGTAVTVTITTHSEGGLTDGDFELARRIDSLD